MVRELILSVLTLAFAASAFCAEPLTPPAPSPPPVGGSPAAPDQSPVVALFLSSIPVPDLAERLAALHPDSPVEYFRLGEEVAAEVGVSDLARSLAQQLFVLAFELDRRPGRTPDAALGRSVCLALASIASADPERRWLIALARSMDAIRLEAHFESPGPGVGRREAGLDLATAIGYIRSGEGRRAEQLLQRPEVALMLDQYEGLLSAAGAGGSASALRRAMGQWPNCPECRNRRIVVRPGEGGGATILCNTCRGNPGPTLTDAEVLAQLRLESALLSGIHRSWAAQISADSGAPLRDLDPSELAQTYAVDPAKPVWRAGGWTAADGDSGRAAPPAATRAR